MSLFQDALFFGVSHGLSQLCTTLVVRHLEHQPAAALYEAVAALHFILPVVVLVWALMVDRLSPGLSAFWATGFMIFICFSWETNDQIR